MSRPLYIYRLAVEIPDHLRWPHEPDNWPEVYERHGWDATPDPHPDAWSNGFQWPRYDRRYHSKQAADKRAAFLRDLGATVVVERSLPVEWPNGGTT